MELHPVSAMSIEMAARLDDWQPESA